MAQDGRPARPESAHREHEARRVAGRPRRRVSSLGLGGAVAAAAILVAACGNSGPNASASAAIPSYGTASTAPSVQPAGQLNLTFQAAHDSKIYGGAQINDLGDGSSLVSIGLVAIGFDLPMPAALAAGTCAAAIAAPVPSPSLPSAAPSVGASAAPGASASAGPSASIDASASPAASPSLAASPSASAAASPSASAPPPGTLPADLNPISGGGSTSQIGFTLAKILASPSAIVIRKSGSDLTVVACADVTSSPAASAAP
jgi:hypothetical protein